MPFNPAAMHSHQPRYPELAPVRGHCGAVCCRPRELRRHLHRTAFAASDALAHPRRGTLRKTRLVFALHPALPGSGQGCPAFRPGRPPHSRPGGNVTPKSAPGRTALKSVLLCVAIPEAGLSPQSSPGGQHPLDAPRIRVAPAVRAPGAPVFDYRRRAGPFSLRRLGFTGVALRAPR
jgi:hypothetical protein